jgi:8-oxo-dGTP pyrophosphatase MutT (NUDIX family)
MSLVSANLFAGGAGHQVAALCWRRAPIFEILLVTTLRSHSWVLPKGWADATISLADAAAREALEEAGVTGLIHPEPIGRYHYLKTKKAWGALPCRVDVFSLMVTGQARHFAEKGARQVLWLPIDQAAARVSEPGLRHLILDFRRNRLAA